VIYRALSPLTAARRRRTPALARVRALRVDGTTPRPPPLTAQPRGANPLPRAPTHVITGFFFAGMFCHLVRVDGGRAHERATPADTFAAFAVREFAARAANKVRCVLARRVRHFARLARPIRLSPQLHLLLFVVGGVGGWGVGGATVALERTALVRDAIKAHMHDVLLQRDLYEGTSTSTSRL
jgi:hypothetical protein